MVFYDDGDWCIPRRAKGTIPSSSDCKHESRPTPQQAEAIAVASKRRADEHRMAQENAAATLVNVSGERLEHASKRFASVSWCRPIRKILLAIKVRSFERDFEDAMEDYAELLDDIRRDSVPRTINSPARRK